MPLASVGPIRLPTPPPALATAIIEELRGKGVKLACTTHYAELKAYALETPGVENGCCEDRKSVV